MLPVRNICGFPRFLVVEAQGGSASWAAPPPTHMFTWAHTGSHGHTQTHAGSHRQTQAHMDTHKFTRTHTDTYRLTHTGSHRHTQAHTDTGPQGQTHIHTHLHTLACLHALAHTCRCMFAHTHRLPSGGTAVKPHPLGPPSATGPPACISEWSVQSWATSVASHKAAVTAAGVGTKRGSWGTSSPEDPTELTRQAAQAGAHPEAGA